MDHIDFQIWSQLCHGIILVIVLYNSVYILLNIGFFPPYIHERYWSVVFSSLPPPPPLSLFLSVFFIVFVWWWHQGNISFLK